MSFKWICWISFVAIVLGTNTIACEQCKCQGLNPIEKFSLTVEKDYAAAKHLAATPEESAPAEPLDSYYKWHFDTLFEYVKYRNPNVALDHAILGTGRDTHGHEREFNITQRFAYNINADLQVSIAQGYRFLQQREIDDENILGRHEHSNGPTDLDFGVSYRFLHQSDCGSPVDLQVFASVKPPIGKTNNLRPNGSFFETEDQPGTGSWNETIGLSASKRWGAWGASAAYGYTHKGEGTRRFKEGDVNRLSLTGTRKMTPDDWSWQLFLNQGIQGFIENEAVDHGVTSRDHGGHFIYAVPGVTIIPNKHLILTASGSVPIFQHENGFHQPDRYGIQFNVGVRF